MKKRPWPLIMLAVIHLLTPIGNIAVNSWLLKIGFMDYLSALVQPYNVGHAFIFFGIPLISAGLIWICKKWSYYTYIGFMSVPFIYSFFSWADKRTPYTGFVLILFYIINIFIVGYFMLPAVRIVYFDPRLRWWETKPRYLTDFVARTLQNGKEIVGQIKNISQGGVYLECEGTLPMNDLFMLQFKVAEEEFKLDCVAIYHRAATPAGYGLKLQMDAKTSAQISSLLARLEKEGSLIAGRAPTPEDTFSFWFKSLFKTKSAWVPQPGRPPEKKS